MRNKSRFPLPETYNYSYGMVLGIEDFKQEQNIFIDRLRLHSHMLHGYGTLLQILRLPLPRIQPETIPCEHTV